MTPGGFLRLFIPLIAARCVLATTPVRVVDREGRGVPSAVVSILGNREACITDTLGMCSLPEFPPGRYRIVVRAVGHHPDTLDFVQSRLTIVTLRSSAFPLDPIAVTAPREQEPQRTTAFVTSLDPGELRTSNLTVPDLLNEVVGLQVRSTGGFGSFSTISVRSSSSEQVRVYLDGIPLNQALGGGVNIAAIPASAVQQIDVYRGVIPPSFGGSGTAGVVNFVTRQARDSLDWRIDASYGTWDTRTLSGWFTRRIGPISAVASADYSHSDNDFPYLDDNGTTFNTSDDTWAARTNNQFNSINTLLRLSSGESSLFRWKVSHCYLFTENHLPGNSAYHELPNNARIVSGQHLSEIMVGAPLPLLSEAEVRGYRSFRRDRFENPDGMVGLGRSMTDDTAAVWGGQISVSSFTLPAQRVSAFASAAREGFFPNDALITDPAARDQTLRPSRRTQYSAFLSDELALSKRRFVLTGNVGFLGIKNDLLREETASRTWTDSTTSSSYPRAVGIILSPYPWLSLRANWGHYTRVPNLFELFGNRGSSVGNPLLLPETGTNRDAGFSLTTDRSSGRFRRGTAEVVVFENTTTNMIAYWSAYNRMKPFNVGKATVRGVEVSGSWVTSFGLSGNLGVTWQHPRNESTLFNGLYYGYDLPHRPRWQIDWRAEYQYSVATLSYGFHYHNRFYGQPVNSISDDMPAAFLHDLGLRLRLTNGFSVTVDAKNLGNVREFHSRYVPLPGRSFFVSTQLTSF